MKIKKINSCSECEESWYDRNDNTWHCNKIFPKDSSQINVNREIYPDCPLDDYPECYDEMLQALIDYVTLAKIEEIYIWQESGMDWRSAMKREISIIEKATRKPIEEVLK